MAQEPRYFTLTHAGDQAIGDGEVRWAIEHITSEVREILLQMPARQAGKSRLDTLLYMVDDGIRGARVERRNEGESHFDRENPGQSRNRMP